MLPIVKEPWFCTDCCLQSARKSRLKSSSVSTKKAPSNTGMPLRHHAAPEFLDSFFHVFRVYELSGWFEMLSHCFPSRSSLCCRRSCTPTTHTCTYIYIYVYIHTCMYVYVYIYVYYQYYTYMLHVLYYLDIYIFIYIYVFLYSVYIYNYVWYLV